MRVICVDASKGSLFGDTPKFKEGEILDATQSTDFDDGYFIEGHIDNYPPTFRKSWVKKRFIPLSSIDETEKIKETEYASAR